MYFVYGKENCPACTAAKNLLEKTKQRYIFIDVSLPTNKEALLERVPSASTVPQIIKDEKYLGGFNELKRELTVLESEQTGPEQLNG